MKKLLALLLALVMVFSMVACSSNKDAATPAQDAAAEPAAPQTPANDTASDSSDTSGEKNMTLSILWTGTGNGEMANEAVAMLEEEYGVDVALEYNTVAHEVFQPMLVAGNPPDIAMIQVNFFDHFAAASEGAYTDITSYLSLPVNGGSATVYDVANPSVLDSTKVGGANYLTLASVNTENICYNKALFEEHGWSVPETWDEFIALCAEIKSTTDIAPFAWTGMYPYYASPFVFPMICAIGDGAAEYTRFNNMEEGWWVSEPVQEAMSRIQYMRDQGYLVEGMNSMNHTGSQMEFINGNIAMICVGSWLEVEMDGNWPEGFELSVMHAPVEKAGDEKFVTTAGDIICFPAAAKNKDWIGEFLQDYYSEQSAVYNAKNGCIVSPYYVSDSEAVRSVMSDFSIDAFSAADEATMLYPLAKIWYKEWWDVYQNTLTALVSGEIDAAEFCQQMEDATAAVRNDDSITKYVAG